VETVQHWMKKSGCLAKDIFLEAIPHIAAMDWDPICDQYKVNELKLIVLWFWYVVVAKSIAENLPLE